MLSQCTYQAHPFSSFVSDIHKPSVWPICGSWAQGTAIRMVDVMRVCSYSLLVPFRFVSAQYWTFYLMMDSFWACLTLWLGRSNTNQFRTVSSSFMARVLSLLGLFIELCIILYCKFTCSRDLWACVVILPLDLAVTCYLVLLLQIPSNIPCALSNFMSN